MRTVLIADDEPSLRLLVGATLESDLYEVVEAADGDEAWEMVQRLRPQVAILDVQMPGRTGLELAQAIKADPDLRSTKVIILTSKSRNEDAAAGNAAGVDIYLTKPFSPLQLMTVVEDALEVQAL
jgi:CheY-like chemotaxis protein